jgi:hypothetical protein
MKKVLFVFAIAAAFAACNNASESTPAADSTKVDTPAVAPAPVVDTTKVDSAAAVAPAADTTKK